MESGQFHIPIICYYAFLLGNDFSGWIGSVVINAQKIGVTQVPRSASKNRMCYCVSRWAAVFSIQVSFSCSVAFHKFSV